MSHPLSPASERIPNLAPMVDVIMVILVFFMLGASLDLFREGALRTELDPRSGPGPGAAVEIIPAVKIALADVDDGAGCAVFVMGQPLEGGIAALRTLLEQKVRQGADVLSPVVIAAEATTRWRYVVAAMDACQQAGFTNVQFAVHLR